MYGLKKAAILAYKQLVKNLKQHGYEPTEGTTGLWHHASRPTKFASCVDDFGVKYFSKDDAEHLITTLNKYYSISEDWTGKNYCVFNINWNYKKEYVDINMPKYIQKALMRKTSTTYKKRIYPFSIQLTSVWKEKTNSRTRKHTANIFR